MFTLAELLDDLAPGLTLQGAERVCLSGGCVDSREADDGMLFAALAGERTDGHLYVGAAWRAGALAALVERVPEGAGCVIDLVRGSLPERVITPMTVVVPNVLAALQRLAQGRRRARPDVQVIGVTGSVGKTTTKETIAAVLGVKQSVLRSAGNQNNEIGLPLTLLGLEPEHRCAVLEMGMYALGEVAALCVIAQPQVGVVTNVGPVHLERLGSLERIAQAKAELVQALPADGLALLNGDDARVAAMGALTRARVATFGLHPEQTVWAGEVTYDGLAGARFTAHTAERPDLGLRSEAFALSTPALGEQGVLASLPAVALGRLAGMEWPDIQRGLRSQGFGLRLVPIAGQRGSTLLDDSYNASPAATCAALRLLGSLPAGRRIAALGDMLELGDYEAQGHGEVGRCASRNVDVLITVGQRMRTAAEEAERSGLAAERIHVLETAASAVDLLQGLLGRGDVLLVKGSHSMGMGAIVEALKERQA